MVQPAYIICCSGKSEDRETRLISLFNLVEQITFTPGESSQAGVSSVSVVSVWQLDPDDSGKSFGARLSYLSPAGEEKYEQVLPSFEIKIDNTAVLHRFVVNVRGFPALTQKGFWRIQLQLQRNDSDCWQSQSYPFFVDPSEAYISAMVNAEVEQQIIA